MSTFLTSACCHGRSPRQFKNQRLHERPRLVARMAAKRQVARFLVAPTGYGKSSLAALYAQMMFGNLGVMWVDAASPYFLRDLDKGALDSQIMSTESDLSLVVIDSLPPLSPPRVTEMVRIIDRLLSEGCEVIVTCSPGSDYYARYQVDRVLLTADDLLVNDAELPRAGVQGNCWSQEWSLLGKGGDVELLRHVPMLYWNGPDAVSEFVRSMASEPLPSKVLRAMFVMAVLQNGYIDAASKMLQEQEMPAIVALTSRYPHFGVNTLEGTFAVAPLPLETVVEAFRPKIAAEWQPDGTFDPDAFLSDLSCQLGPGSDYARVCQLVGLLGSHDMRLGWLALHGVNAVGSFCLDQAEQLLSSVRIPAGSSGSGLLCLRAFVRALLRDERGACQIAARVLGAQAPSAQDAVHASLLLARYGTLEQRREAVFHATGATFLGPSSILASARGLIQEDPLMLELVGKDVEALPVLARACLMNWASEFAPYRVFGALEHEAPVFLASPAFSRYVFAKAWRNCAAVGMELPEGIASQVSTILAHGEASLEEQRRQYAKRTADQAAAVRPRHAGRPLNAVESDPEHPVPVLYVRLMGSLEVYIGDKRVSFDNLRRKNVRILLALLVLNEGRELPRDRVVESMWPDSNVTSARKNIYTVTSYLRRALTLPDGTCPYFIRLDSGFKIDAAHLSSDVGRVRRVCDNLRFGPMDIPSWQEDLAFLRDECMGELLPGERGNNLLRYEKAQLSARMTDAMLTAARRLQEEGHDELALWFSQAAYERDYKREDVYIALMRAQVACGQREAALDTYQRARSFLADEFGLDPSRELIELYRGIVEEIGRI